MVEQQCASRQSAYKAVKSSELHSSRSLLGNEPELIEASTPFGPLLHVAAGVGDEKVLHLLIEHGAALEAQGGTFGGTALDCAASAGRLGATHFLLARGALLNVSELEHNPPFAVICAGSLDVAQLIMAHGIDLNVAYTGLSMEIWILQL